ncbi:YceI family protein [Zavarzinia compransoris]|uniref:YceI family protein n=1 Tax=Zavarzinia marina TaxID=2911065 RepID=UPI001F4466AB|nr:YceI family protein [Zavarzinia marina]MCF4166791.1 YceI family protein [Zavarzinia marina]
MMTFRETWQKFLPIIPLAGAILALPASDADAADAYRIRPGSTTIAFSVDHLGLFQTEGDFTAFDGSLILDLDDPSRSRVDVRVETGSVEVESDEAMAMLRSDDYFDSGDFPEMRFKADHVTSLGDGKVEIDGDLTIRGVTRRQTLQAELTDRRFDPAAGGEVANFIVTGKVDRVGFGMVADRGFVSDDVDLRIISYIRLVGDDVAAR